MKKFTNLLLSCLLLFVIMFSSISCDDSWSHMFDDWYDSSAKVFENKYPKVWDGEYLYEYHSGEVRVTCGSGDRRPHYCIIALEEDFDCEKYRDELGRTPWVKTASEIYIPAYLRGVEIAHLGYECEHGFPSEILKIQLECEKLYLPFTFFSANYFSTTAQHVFVPIAKPRISFLSIAMQAIYQNRDFESIFIPYFTFNRLFDGDFSIGGETERISEYQASTIKVQDNKEYHKITTAANTAYMFNYEGSPNEDYFFINDFERGGLIEDTPYEPLREGYTFGGWYKDSACTEKWDFSADKLPEATYDEEGSFEYVETRLYAKWTKNS